MPVDTRSCQYRILIASQMSRLQALFIVISLGWQTTTGFDLPRRQLLQFPELANTVQGSGLCNKEAASFITATNGSCPLKSTADDCKQSGCYGTRLSGFERVALRCGNPSDIPTLQQAAVVAGYDRVSRRMVTAESSTT